MDRLSIVREVYHTSKDPQRVRRAWLFAERIVAKTIEKNRQAAYRAGNHNWPFPKRAPMTQQELAAAGPFPIVEG